MAIAAVTLGYAVAAALVLRKLRNEVEQAPDLLALTWQELRKTARPWVWQAAPSMNRTDPGQARRDLLVARAAAQRVALAAVAGGVWLARSGRAERSPD